MLRAAERGGNFPALFRRRLGALLVIGILHALIWLGDILTLYALCGFVLLLFRTRSERALLRVGARPDAPARGGVWRTGIRPSVASGSPARGHPGVRPQDDGRHAVRVLGDERLRAGVLPVAGPDCVVATGQGAGDVPPRPLGRPADDTRAACLPSCPPPASHADCLPVGLAGGAALAWADHRGIYYAPGPHGLEYTLIYFFGTHVLALGYLGAFGVAWLGKGRALLSHLAPVGRAALSNYLAQTALIVMLLYTPGLGLSLTLPVWTCLPVGATYYVLQAIASRWWLSSHRYGAAEWVWRMMTYGRAFRLSTGAETAFPVAEA